MEKNIKLVYYGIITIAVIIYAVWIGSDETAASGFGLSLSYILMGIAILGALVSSGLFIKNNPKNAKKLLMVLGALVVVCGLSYAISDGVVLDEYADYDVTTVSKSKLIDMGIYLTLVLGFGAIILTVVTEALTLFKK